MGFGSIRQVALWAVVFAALGVGIYVLVQGASVPPPNKLGPGITIEDSAIPTRSRPNAPETPPPTRTPAPSTTTPASTTAIPGSSAPVKPLPPSRADDDDDDDDDRGKDHDD